MLIKFLFWVSVAPLLTSWCQAEDYAITAKRLVDEVTQQNQPYFNLTLLDAIGARVSGSKQAEQAVIWAKAKMTSYGFDRITLDPVKVPQWSRGAEVASPLGVVVTVLRSLSTLPDDDHPHTGMLNYGTSPKIPSAALSTHAANLLSLQLKMNPNLKLSLELSASELTTISSFNVIGEITGSERPHEVILVGDQDGGAGVVQSLEIVRAKNFSTEAKTHGTGCTFYERGIRLWIS